jgi:hypothetical protein
MLTLAEAARRDALNTVRPDHIVRWRADVKAKCLALIASEYAKKGYDDIRDIDIKAIDGPLDDGLADATYDLTLELE